MFLLISQVIGFLGEGLGMNLAPLSKISLILKML